MSPAVASAAVTTAAAAVAAPVASSSFADKLPGLGEQAPFSPSVPATYNSGSPAMVSRNVPAASTGRSPASANPPPAAASARLSPTERRVALEVINVEVRNCRRCDELAAGRTQTVFGVGSPTPRLCFFGEAPGADEDRQGVPFVGRAGQLLDKIIEAMGIQRDDVYILNVLKCRPPNNRVPSEEEVENCRGFFERQLDVLQPEFICCLGATAAKTLLHSGFSLGKMRGRFFTFGAAQVIVTYHPAYLLRNPAAKKDTWEDIQLLMRAMGLPVK
jgi:DNA polymerase